MTGTILQAMVNVVDTNDAVSPVKARALANDPLCKVTRWRRLRLGMSSAVHNRIVYVSLKRALRITATLPVAHAKGGQKEYRPWTFVHK